MKGGGLLCLLMYSPSAFKHKRHILNASNKSLKAALALSKENSSSRVIADFNDMINLSNLGWILTSVMHF